MPSGLDHSWSANPDVVYGDRWDLMSAMNVWRFAGAFDESADPNSGPGLNAPNLARLGAIPEDRVWTPARGGNPTLAALNHPEATGYLMARLRPSDVAPGRLTSTYTIELRQKDGWDRGIPRSALLVHVRSGQMAGQFLLATTLLSGGTGWDLQTGDRILLAGKIEVMGVIGPAGGGAPTASNALLQFTHLAGAPSTWSNPVGYVSSVSSEAAGVVFRGDDDGIHELWLTEDSGVWQHWNLWGQANAPTADLTGLGSSTPAWALLHLLRDAARVVYRGDDAHIHELWLTTGSASWQHADLTAIAAGTPAWGEPVGYFTPLRDAARVVYAGPDDHVHELWLTDASGSWRHADLSGLAGAPRIWGNPAPYYSLLQSAAASSTARDFPRSSAHPPARSIGVPPTSGRIGEPSSWT